MQDVIGLLNALAWPAVVGFAVWRFHGAITALLTPATSGETRVKVGASGVEISRIATSAATAAVAAASRKDSQDTDETRATQTTIIRNIAEAVAGGLPAADAAGAARLLWVDDQPANNALLVEAFRGLGITVQEALDTESGLRALQGGRFDLVITDMARPSDGEAGLTLIRRMREAGHRQPVIIFAARWAAANRGREAAVGADLITNDGSEVYAFVLGAVRTRR